MVIMPVRLDTTPANTKTPPPAANPQPSNEERKPDMPKETTKPEPIKTGESSPSLLDQIEQVKESAKTLVRDLNNLTDAVKQQEKDKRASEKELENARAVLKKLQQVTI